MHREKIQELALKSCRFIIYLIPFAFLYVPDFLAFPHVTWKALCFRILVLASFFIWLLFIRKDKNKQDKFPLIPVFFFLYLIFTLFSDLLNGPTVPSILGTVIRMGGFIETLFLVTYFFLLTEIFKLEHYIYNFKLWCYSSIYVFILNVTQYYYNGHERVSLVYGNPIHVSIFSSFISFISLFLFYETGKKRFLFIMFLNLLVVYMGVTKSVIIGILGSLIFYVIYRKIHKLQLL